LRFREWKSADPSTLNVVFKQLRGNAMTVNHVRENVGLGKQQRKLLQHPFTAAHSDKPIVDDSDTQDFPP
jgi:hypothetical protein